MTRMAAWQVSELWRVRIFIVYAASVLLLWQIGASVCQSAQGQSNCAQAGYGRQAAGEVFVAYWGAARVSRTNDCILITPASSRGRRRGASRAGDGVGLQRYCTSRQRQE